jgi:serine phosphatase RsbU (regulator of sigma subunit)
MTMAVGGHPAPLLARTDGSVREVAVEGTLLGLVDDPKLADVSLELAPGETILLYTDGVTEAAAPHRVWVPEDLIEVAGQCSDRSAQGLVDHVAEAALAGLTAPPRDDIAMLALRLTER